METQTKSQHTQGKWNVNLTNEIMPDLAIFCNGLQIATLEQLVNKKEKEANAQRIVKAVNMHDELVSKLKDALSFIEKETIVKTKLQSDIEQLLKQSEEKSKF